MFDVIVVVIIVFNRNICTSFYCCGFDILAVLGLLYFSITRHQSANRCKFRVHLIFGYENKANFFTPKIAWLRPLGFYEVLHNNTQKHWPIRRAPWGQSKDYSLDAMWFWCDEHLAHRWVNPCQWRRSVLNLGGGSRPVATALPPSILFFSSLSWTPYGSGQSPPVHPLRSAKHFGAIYAVKQLYKIHIDV